MRLLRRFEKAFWAIPFKLFPSTPFWVRVDGVWFACSLKRPHDVLIPLAVYEKPLMAFVLNNLVSGSRFLGVGAHLGGYMLRAVSKVGDGGLVVGVEPDPLNYRCLQASIERNGFNNALLINAAIDREPGFVDFYVEPKGDISGLYGRGAWSKKVRVEATTLGALFRRLGVVFDLVKIDVEGAEPFLLNDLSEFRDFWKMVVVEVHGKAVGKTCGCSFCRKASGLGLNITTVLEKPLVHNVVLKNM